MLTEIVRLYVELDEAQAERFAAETKKEENKELREMVITWEDTIAASEAKGKTIGEVIGLLAATRKSILRVLQLRLKSVPASLRSRMLKPRGKPGLAIVVDLNREKSDEPRPALHSHT